MNYDPSDFNDFADLQGIRQRQQQLKRLENIENRLREAASKKTVSKYRQCPWCGGELAGEFLKCQNCASDLVWVRGYPCKPEDEDELKLKLQNEDEAIQRQAERLEEEKKLWPICSKCFTKQQIVPHNGWCNKCNKEWLNEKRFIVVFVGGIILFLSMYCWDWLASVEIVFISSCTLFMFGRKGPLISSLVLLYLLTADFIPSCRYLFNHLNSFLFTI